MKTGIKIHIFQGHEFVIPKFSLSASILDLKIAMHELKGYVPEQQLICTLKSEQNIPDSLKIKDICGEIVEGLVSLQLRLFNRVIPLRIVRPEPELSDIVIKMYPCSCIHKLKGIIEKQTGIPVSDQTLSYNGIMMEDSKLLVDYNIKDPDDTMNISSNEEANATTTSRPFEIHLNVRRLKGKLALGIDFSFNSIKNVKKTNWKPTAPPHREVTDGLSWICYCRNLACPISNEMFIVNRGTFLIKSYDRIRTFPPTQRIEAHLMSGLQKKIL